MEEEDGARQPVILVADDEVAVRSMVQIVLRRAGYIVLAAADGAEALELARAYDGTIHLLLTDVMMPKMIGPELAAVVAQERPSTRVLLMTGHSSGTIPPSMRQRVLRKPFPPNDLLNRIQCELDDNAPNWQKDSSPPEPPL